MRILLLILLSGLFGCATSSSVCSGGMCGTTPVADRAIYVDPMLVADVFDLPVSGKLTVVDFWDTACPPCISAMPAWEALWQQADKSRVVIVGVSLDEDIDVTRQTIESGKVSVTFPMVYDGDALALTDIYNIGAVRPVTLVLDEGGTVIFDSRQSGVESTEAVKRILVDRELL